MTIAKMLTTIICAVPRPFFGHQSTSNYFSHFPWQPEQPELLIEDRFAGGCNVVRQSGDIMVFIL